MKQSIYSILFILLFFTSSVLLAASWQGSEDSSVRFTPVNSQVQATPPEERLRALEQAVLESYNTYVADAPEAEDIESL